MAWQVFLKDNRVYSGHLYYDRSLLLQQVSILEPSDKLVPLRVTRIYNFTSAEAFLVHSSCYSLLQETTQSRISPSQLFRLCQSLQPDRERNFGYDKVLDLSGNMTDLLALGNDLTI